MTDAGKTGQGRMLKLKQIESGIDSVVKVDPSITFRKDINILSDERVGIPGEKQRRTRGNDAGVGVTTKGQRIRGAFDLQKSEKELIEDFTKSINKVGETNPNYKRFFWLNLIAPSRLSNELFDVVIFDKNDTEAKWYKNWKDPNNLKNF